MTHVRLGSRLNRALVDHGSPASISSRARAKRWQRFVDLHPDLERMRIVDLGGTVQAWARAEPRPAEVTVLNVFPQESNRSWIKSVVGDACDAAAVLDRAEYDLVYSNSVIEHVGGHHRRRSFAKSVEELAPHHWVQTPYLYFPVEPHWLFPGFQFLPLRARVAVSMNWPLIPSKPQTRADAIRRSQGSELLSRTQLQYYFPGSRIEAEHAAGLIKSLIAIR